MVVQREADATLCFVRVTTNERTGEHFYTDPASAITEARNGRRTGYFALPDPAIAIAAKWEAVHAKEREDRNRELAKQHNARVEKLARENQAYADAYGAIGARIV